MTDVVGNETQPLGSADKPPDSAPSIGLMLYTLRDECARDFEGVLRLVAGMGYTGVEFFDLHGHDASLVRGWLDEFGLTACGRHAGLEAIETNLSALVEEAHKLSWRRLVLSWLDPSTLEDSGLPDRLGRAAAEASAQGLELGFHNHDAELAPLASGARFLDRVPAELFLELDLGWAWYAGTDPRALLESARGRCPLVHVKDFRERVRDAFCPVGDGVVGYEHIIPAATSAGVDWLLVEQDETDGSGFDAVRRSHDALRLMLQESA